TPFRTRPTWTSSTASTSRRAAMSARRWSRAWSIAAARATAWCRSPMTASRQIPAAPSRRARSRAAPSGRGSRAARWRCCGSTVSPMRWRPAHRWSPAARRCGWSSPTGRASPGRARRAPRSSAMKPPVIHVDGLKRCAWPGQDPLYVAYHDTEWGVPEYDDRALYEKLMLDGFQAGLSWITILRKRDNFRRAFDGFEPAAIARYGKRKVESLMRDEGIVRNRAKIEGAVASARAYLEVMDKGPGFSKLLWGFVDGKPKINNFRSRGQVPAETPVSRAMSKELAARGFKFCGPTIVYAFMQATGMVNDHMVTCHRHAALAKPAARR